MRKLISISLVLLLLAACRQAPEGRNGVVYKNAMEYNDYIISRQKQVIKKMLSFGKAAGVDMDSAGRLLDTYAQETALLIKEVQDMPPFKNDSVFREAAVSSFQFYKRVFENDYKQILAVRKRDDLSPEEAQKELSSITEKLARDEEHYDKTFHKAQESFAGKNNMELRANSMQKELDKLN